MTGSSSGAEVVPGTDAAGVSEQLSPPRIVSPMNRLRSLILAVTNEARHDVMSAGVDAQECARRCT